MNVGYPAGGNPLQQAHKPFGKKAQTIKHYLEV
jgi:hypothetical protein